MCVYYAMCVYFTCASKQLCATYLPMPNPIYVIARCNWNATKKQRKKHYVESEALPTSMKGGHLGSKHRVSSNILLHT